MQLSKNYHRASGISISLTIATVLLACSAATRAAIIPFSLGATSYTQSFDSMGSGSSIPSGWAISKTSGSGSGIIDNYSGASSTVGGNATSLSSGTTGESYAFRSGSNDALGFLNASTYGTPTAIYTGFTNNTSDTIITLTLGWDYDKFRSGSREFDWTFFSSTDGTTYTPVTAGNLAYAADSSNSVSSFPPLDTNISGVTLTGLNIPIGSSYYLEWKLTGVAGSSNGQALAIDNFTLAATNGTPAVPEPAGLLLLAISAAVLLGSGNYQRRAR